MVNITIKITGTCHVCGYDTVMHDAELDGHGNLLVSTEPCSHCVEMARDEGEEAGRIDGKAEGRAECEAEHQAEE